VEAESAQQAGKSILQHWILRVDAVQNGASVSASSVLIQHERVAQPPSLKCQNGSYVFHVGAKSLRLLFFKASFVRPTWYIFAH